MRILYIAYSCNPYNGSEDQIGWNIPVECAKNNEVYVITKEEHRGVISKYMKEHDLKNIQFYFVDIPKFYKVIYKGFLYSGRLGVWNSKVFGLAKSICREHNIEIIHQITPVEIRSIGNYGRIKGVKFICGPLGGGERLPNGLKHYAKGHSLIELIRSLMNKWSMFKFNLNGRISSCDFIMYANYETRDYVEKIVSIK